MTATPVFSFQPAIPRVAAERILRIQGYVDTRRVRAPIARAAQAAADMLVAIAEPAVRYRRVRIERLEGDAMELAGSIRLHCAAFPKTLAGCTDVIAFVLTLGAAVDARSAELTRNEDLLGALFLETAGWLAVEAATREFRDAMRALAASAGQRITSRLGPGYSYRIDGNAVDWPLDEHARFFAVFGDAALPVTLTGSSAMLPKMSRSGLFGVGPRTTA